MGVVISSICIVVAAGVIYIGRKYFKKEPKIVIELPIEVCEHANCCQTTDQSIKQDLLCCGTDCCDKEICSCKSGICCHVPELPIVEKKAIIKKPKKAVKKVAPKKKKGK